MKVLIWHDMDTNGVFTPVLIGLIESNSSSFTPLVRIVWAGVNTAIGPVPNKLSTVEWMNQWTEDLSTRAVLFTISDSLAKRAVWKRTAPKKQKQINIVFGPDQSKWTNGLSWCEYTISLSSFTLRNQRDTWYIAQCIFILFYIFVYELYIFPIWTFSLRGVLTFVSSGLDINGCVLSYFEGTANVHCYTSCTLTTRKVSFLQCCYMKDITKITHKRYNKIKDITEYLQKCEGCTHFCEILYIYCVIIFMKNKHISPQNSL